MLMKLIKKMKSEDGAAPIIEATLIMPLITLIIYFLLYLSFYIVQGVTMYSYAQRIAVEAARVISFPGYENFGDLSKNVDFVSIETTSIQSVLGRDLDPYRYFAYGNSLLRGQEDNLEHCVNKLIDDNAFVRSGNTTCEITAHNYVFNQKVEVVVKKPIPVSGWLRYIGIDEDSLDITVKTVAVSSDPAEFIRNTDIVFDMASFLADNFKIGNKTISKHMDDYVSKINNMKDKFGIGK